MQPSFINSTAATSGLVLTRRNLERTDRFASFRGSLVGVVSFPDSFKPIELASYVLDLRSNQFRILNKPLDKDRIYESNGVGIDASFREKIWHTSTIAGVSVVRFHQSFECENTYTIFGVSTQPYVNERYYEKNSGGHAWIGIQNGNKFRPEPPCSYDELLGEGLGQILSSKPLWPNKDGVKYVIPRIEPAWLNDYHKLSCLRADIGNGSLSIANFKKIVSANDRLRLIDSAASEDIEFCTILNRMRQEGQLLMRRPQTASEYQASEKAMADLIAEVNRERSFAPNGCKLK